MPSSNRRISEETQVHLKEEAPHVAEEPNFCLDFVFMTLLDTINVQSDLSITRAKSTEETAAKQRKILDEMTVHTLDYVPDKEWVLQKHYVWVPGHMSHPGDKDYNKYKPWVDGKWKWDGTSRFQPKQGGDFQNIMDSNQQQLNFLQSKQGELDLLQQKAQVNSGFAENAAKSETQTYAAGRAMLDAMITISSKITNPR